MPKRPTNAMTAAVRRAVKASTHLEDQDQAAVQVALQLAAVIDSAAEDDPAAWRKQVGWVAPHLNATLRTLGLTPESRAVRDRYKEDEPGPLEALRARRSAALSGVSAVYGSRTEEMRAIGETWSADGVTE